MYRRFLRARQHDVPRAVEMWTAHLAWRREIGADTILEDFHFPERDAFISLYPQGYCNVDKQARASLLCRRRRLAPQRARAAAAAPRPTCGC